MQRIGAKILEEVLQDYIKEVGIGDRLRGLAVCGLWEKAVGSRMAAATRDVRFNDGVLYCRMTSSTARNMLFYNLEGVRNELNRLSGETIVKKIILI